MIFVDTNVFMYAVGRPHPLQSAAQDFFAESADNHLRLFTSAEVLQELFHVYEATGRMAPSPSQWNSLTNPLPRCGRWKEKMLGWHSRCTCSILRWVRGTCATWRVAGGAG